MKIALITYGPLSEAILAEIRAAIPTAEVRYRPGDGRCCLATPDDDDDPDLAFMNALHSLTHAGRLRWVRIAPLRASDTFRSSPAWQRSDITITTAGRIAANSVAEYVLAMILWHGHLRRGDGDREELARLAADADYPRLAARPSTAGRSASLASATSAGGWRTWPWTRMQVVAMRRKADPPAPTIRPRDSSTPARRRPA